MEGRTWFAHDMHPRLYTTLIADALLHRIHTRVLEQVKRQTENPPAGQAVGDGAFFWAPFSKRIGRGRRLVSEGPQFHFHRSGKEAPVVFFL